MLTENLNNSVSNTVNELSALSSDVLMAAFMSLPDAIYLFDQHRVLVSTNASSAKFSGGSAEPLGKRCCDMFWAAIGSDKCVVDRALEFGQRVEVEIWLSGDGSKPVLVIVEPIVVPQARRSVLVIARDISKLRQSEAEALAQRSFMANIADLSLDEIYALDKKGRITWLNNRAQVETSINLLGRYFVEFIAEDVRDVANDSLQRALLGEESQDALRSLRNDGTLREVEAHTSPLWKDGDVSGVLVFLRDVTEKRRTQELAAQSDKLRAVGELAAGVAHNLNNSLTVIQGRAQLLMMREQDESVLKSLKIITSAVEDGSKTLRRILEFARRESGEFAPVELEELLTSSVEIAKPKWYSKSNPTKIEVKIECSGPVYVMGETAELREVVLNLLFNAVDAMPDGGTLELGARSELESGCFWVADTGKGMDLETSARIFEPFFTTKGKSGTGLGLSASHGIITRHKGEILVVSEPGEGTRFEVRLPICDLAGRVDRNGEESEEELRAAIRRHLQLG